MHHKVDCRENIPASDEVTLIEHHIRHGNMVTHISVTDDPIFLRNPWSKVRSSTKGLTLDAFNLFGRARCAKKANKSRGSSELLT
jgi:hypothetical protein